MIEQLADTIFDIDFTDKCYASEEENEYCILKATEKFNNFNWKLIIAVWVNPELYSE